MLYIVTTDVIECSSILEYWVPVILCIKESSLNFIRSRLNYVGNIKEEILEDTKVIQKFEEGRYTDDWIHL